MKSCLDNFEPLKSFASICNDVNGVPWVTVFKEEKKSNENFESIDDDKLAVFCILDDPSNDDLSYLGHFMLPKTTPCHEFFKRVTNGMDKITDDSLYSMHTFTDGTGFSEDVKDSPLALNEVRSIDRHLGTNLLFSVECILDLLWL